MKNENENKNLSYALSFANHGFSIIPLLPGEKKPRGKWIERQKTKMSRDEIIKHWKKHPDDNIGIVTGKISNIIVFDCDSQQAILHFEKMIDGKPDTYIVKTAKGAHYYFRYPKEKSLFNNRVKVFPDIDIRGDGGYVVAAGSIHPTGAMYEEEQAIDEVRIAELPPELMKLLRQEQEHVEKNEENNSNTPATNEFESAMNSQGITLSSKYGDLLAGVSKGTRNDSTARLAGALIRKGLSGESLFELMKLWNTNNRPPLPEGELIKTIKSIEKRDRQNIQDSIPVLTNLVILGVDEEGHTVFYIKDIRVTHYVDLPRLSYNQAVQIIGDDFMEVITENKFSKWKQNTIWK